MQIWRETSCGGKMLLLLLLLRDPNQLIKQRRIWIETFSLFEKR